MAWELIRYSKDMKFKTYELFTSGILHLPFSDNAYANPKITFTPLPFPFYQTPDSSLSKHPLLP